MLDGHRLHCRGRRRVLFEQRSVFQSLCGPSTVISTPYETLRTYPCNPQRAPTCKRAAGSRSRTLSGTMIRQAETAADNSSHEARQLPLTAWPDIANLPDSSTVPNVRLWRTLTTINAFKSQLVARPSSQCRGGPLRPRSRAAEMKCSRRWSGSSKCQRSEPEPDDADALSPMFLSNAPNLREQPSQ